MKHQDAHLFEDAAKQLEKDGRTDSATFLGEVAEQLRLPHVEIRCVHCSQGTDVFIPELPSEKAYCWTFSCPACNERISSESRKYAYLGDLLLKLTCSAQTGLLASKDYSASPQRDVAGWAVEQAVQTLDALEAALEARAKR